MDVVLAVDLVFWEGKVPLRKVELKAGTGDASSITAIGDRV